jgi:hypothetical protein
MDEFEAEFAPDLLVDKVWWAINVAMWTDEMGDAGMNDEWLYLQTRLSVAAAEYDRASAEMMLFMKEHAERGVDKPYEICGNLDNFWENEDTGESGYRLQCQYPKGHAELGFRWHAEFSGGNLVGEWGNGTWPKA